MSKIVLRKINITDGKYFAKWWRDKDLRKLTSGRLGEISDRKVDKYFQNILNNKKDIHFMITVGGETVGHIVLAKRRGNWFETQIVIGEKNYWDKKYGSRAISLLLRRAKRFGIQKIYLEVRPTNIRAICAYKKCGFQKVKIVKYPQNKYLPETLRMEFKKIKKIKEGKDPIKVLSSFLFVF